MLRAITMILRLLIVLTLALGLVVTASGSVLAQAPTPSIAISTSSGSPSTTVTVNGLNFAANEAGIVVTYDSVPIVTGILAGPTGFWSATLVIPLSASGIHIIDAYGATTPAASVADKTFAVMPAISINRLSGSSGTPVSVSGSGFGAGETGITVTYDGTVVASGISVSTTGSWSAAFNIPASAGGSHTIDAYGASTPAANVPDIGFNIVPTISTNRASGSSGTAVTISGAGFVASETGITVTYDGVSVASGIFASATGSWSATFNIPPSAGGSHTISASGTSTPAFTVPTVNFSIAPTLSISRSSGSPGTAITVTGSGFSAGETGITITYDGTPVASGISAGATGSWSAPFNVPASASGPHIIRAYGSSTQAGSVPDISFTIGAGISLSRTSGTAGTSVTVTGSGFSAGETGITVTYDGTPVASGISASPTGSWSAPFNIPPSASGSHIIDAFGTYTQAGNVPDISFAINSSISTIRARGSPGTAITVTGSGFGASETGITVTFDGTPVASGISASPTGSWSATFNIPPSTSGSHIIDAYGVSTQAANVTDLSFTITPGISINKANGSPGTAITVTGSGFSAGETGITVTYDGTPVAPEISANSAGSWSASFNIPASASGSHVIDASGASTQAANVADLNFTITPGIAINKASGSPGAPITVNGSGFGASESGITVTFDGTPVASGISASPTGSWSATFNVPAAASGSHAIDAYGAGSTQAVNVPDVSFIIGPVISTSQTSGTVGTTVTVTGSGFSASEMGITVTYDGTPVVSRIAASSNGSWSASFNVPASASGSHAIDAYGASTQAPNVSDLSFTVSPSVSINPASGNVGIKIDVTGSGFAANSRIPVTYNGAEIADAAATSDASGSFNLSISAPKSKGGTHTIKVMDSSKGEAQATFTMESTPPRTPTLLLPKTGTRIGILGDITPTLDWSDVEDPSGVTYVVQMDTSPEFPSPFLEITKLTTSSHTLTEDQALPRGSYYWRAKAIDGASNESAWSQPWLLKAGLMALWTLITIIVLGVAIVGGASYYFLLRRPRWKRAPEVAEGEVVTPSVYVRVFKPEETPGIPRAGIPRRLLKQASPALSKPAEEVPAEEQVRAKMTVEFARSLPLIQPVYNVDWLAELVQLASGMSEKSELCKQLLQGEMTIGYQPDWRTHPLYPDMVQALEGQPLLNDLDNYVEAVGHCASECIVLLQSIYRDALPEITEAALENRGWAFIFGVYADALGWFRGRFLRQPSEQDYSVKTEVGGEAGGVCWLYGQEGTPFAGPLMQALDEKQALQLRDLHLGLRRKYRQSDSAKSMVEMIVQLDLARNKVLKNLSRVGTTFNA